jgi:transposase
MKGEYRMHNTLLHDKRRMIEGMTIVGIDPAKAKHQAVILDSTGSQRGKTFSFDVTHEGYCETLWGKVRQIVPNCNPQNTAFAIETSCNLWLTLAFYLHSEGYRVVLVSPLTTYHARPMVNHDFSRTDPKDAMLIAANARQGYYDRFVVHEPLHSALHRLSITYDKLRKECAQNRARLRALIEQIFPEFLTIVEPDTQSAMYLLKRYLFPDEFLSLNIAQESDALVAISRHQYGMNSMIQLQRAAHHTIGVVTTAEDRIAERITLDCWLAQIETISANLERIFNELVRCAGQLPEYHILLSLKGVSETTAALFLAEVQDIHRFSHYKQIEKRAGMNLRLSQSGQFVGTRHISHLGNSRLRWLLYSMTEETARWIPEVRIKYLQRQMKVRRHRKNIVASCPQLLKLIMALVKERRTYEIRQDSLARMTVLEQQYAEFKEKRKNKKRAFTEQAA